MTRNRRIFNFLRRVAASAWCVMLFVLLVNNGRLFLRKDPTWERVRETGVLRVGMDASYRPFGELTADEVRGLDVDLAREIAARLGVQAQIVPMGIDGLYDALKTGQVDCLISALSADPTRWGEVIYTRPYIDAGQFIVSRRDGLASMTDLDGLTVAVEYGSVGDELARRWTRRLKTLNVARFVSTEEALDDAAQGKADAALVDQIAARLYRRAQSESGLIIAAEPVLSEGYTVATRGAALELAGKINAALELMDSDGVLREIIERWL